MTTVFIVGAGFSLDANASIAPADRQRSWGYPLVNELASTCFRNGYELSGGVEMAFDEARRRGDREPIAALVELVQNADHYAGLAVANTSSSPYHMLIDEFPDSVFLSFNYDGLLELLLHKRRLWTPVDGFGILCRADVDESYLAAARPPTRSVVRVFHLHGSVYLHSIEFEFYERPERRPSNMQWLRLTDSEEVQFDPDSLSLGFIPFHGGAVGRTTYKLPTERIIVPSPSKTEALRDRFSRAVYRNAANSLTQATRCIAIGYSFADCDVASFQPLLHSASQGPAPQLEIIAPDAVAIAARVRPFLANKPIALFRGTFAEWAVSGFTLQESRTL